MSTARTWVVAALAGIVPVGVLTVFFLVPVGGIVGLGLFPQGRLELGGVAESLWRPRVGRVVWFTLWSSSLASAITVLLGVPTAFVLYRLRFGGRMLLRTLVAVPFVLPTVVVGVAFRSLLAPAGILGFLGWDASAAAIVAALVFFNVSVVVRIVGPAWEGLGERGNQAATALGASPAQVFWTVTLPGLAPAVRSAAAVVFLFCATAFGVVLTLGGLRYATVETEIYLLTTQFLDLQGAAALSLLQVVFVVGLLTLSARRTATVSARSARPRRLRRGDTPAMLVCAATLTLLALPIAGLVVRSLRVGGDWSLANYRALGGKGTTAGGGSTLDVSVVAALDTSLRVAVDACLIAVLLGTLIAVLVTRRPPTPGLRRGARALDGLFMLPLGVSAVTVGFGFLVALDRPPVDFRGSAWLIPVAQALVALPLVVRTLAPALHAVDPRLREAAASLGAGPVRVLRDVDLAAAWRPLLAAAGFAFAVSLGEFGATSFLTRPEQPTLPVLIYQLLSRPEAADFGTALAASVVLGAVTASVMVAVESLHDLTRALR